MAVMFFVLDPFKQDHDVIMTSSMNEKINKERFEVVIIITDSNL